MSTIVVSPHFDDAVLSANARLQRRDASVVTVFTALPDCADIAEWDELTGARCSRDRMAERFEEDDEALRRLGVGSAGRLGAMDDQYRAGASADRDRIAVALAEAIGADVRELWLPAAIGGHPDHVAVRDVGIRLAAGRPDIDVFLYADFPYVVQYGWPAWVTGGAETSFLRSDLWLARELRECGLPTDRLTPIVVALGDDGAIRKRHSIGAYASQLPALGLTDAQIDAEPNLLRYELAWRVTAESGTDSVT